MFSIPQSVLYGVVYDNNRWQFGIGGNWKSGRFYTRTASRLPIFDANQNLAIAYQKPNANQLDNYVQFNFSAAHMRQITTRVALRTGISVQNVLDSQPTINRSYRINTFDATVQEINTAALGRTFNAFVRVLF